MKIYICENRYEPDCGVFSTLEAAILHLNKCRSCEVQLYELAGEEFQPSGDGISWVNCENCGIEWRTDQAATFTMNGEPFCSELCRHETAEFYGSGNRGIVGNTTRQVRQRIVDAVMRNADPYEGCHSRRMLAAEEVEEPRELRIPMVVVN